MILLTGDMLNFHGRPERGSFPLDHDGTKAQPPISISRMYIRAVIESWLMCWLVSLGECKDVMTRYLACMKKVKGTNDPECRNIAKSYLACRMDR